MTDHKMREAFEQIARGRGANDRDLERNGSGYQGVIVQMMWELWQSALSAQASAEPVGYLDIGAGGYLDIGSDLGDEELMKLPKGRHMLGIVGTYGIDGYVPAPPRAAGPVVPEGYVLVKLTEISDGVLVAPEFSRLSNKAICETYSAGQRENYSTKTARHIAGLRAVERAAMLATAPTSQSCSPTAQHADTATGHVSESANSERVPARWYMVNKDGAATLCVSQVDALKEAAEANLCWPHLSPHQAVLLGPVHDFATMVERGTKAWADTPGKWLEDLRGNDTDKAKGVELTADEFLALKEVIRISDRKHDAWEAMHTFIASHETKQSGGAQ